MSYHDSCKDTFSDDLVTALRAEAEARLERVSTPDARIQTALRLSAVLVESAAYDLARCAQSAMTAKLILTAADLDRTADFLGQADSDR